MITLDPLPLFFVGDHHGSYTDLFDIIKQHDIKDSYLIHVGDGGEGFITNRDKQLRQYDYINDHFKNRNIFYKSIRGNHSNPLYFRGENRIHLSHFELIEDYTLGIYQGKTIQFIGGAISIDRVARSPNVSYWEDEAAFFDKDKCSKVDILVTHTAPSWCFPYKFNEMVLNWARRDAYLTEDLIEERSLLDAIFKICSPSLHLYGHFHTSWTEQIHQCKHKLLNINEFWMLNA